MQSPSALSPFNNPTRCRERRNVVLQAMVDAGSSTQEAADARRAGAARRSCSARSKPKRRTSSTTSTQTLDEDYPGLTTTTDQAGRCLHDARPAPAAPRAGRGPRRPDQRGRAALAAPAQGARRSRAHRRRSAHRRDPRDGRRPFLQPVAVQPRDRRRGASQARCSSRSSTSRRSRRPPRTADRRHAGLARGRRADDLGVRRSGVGAGELRGRIRRPRSRCGARSPSRATSRRSRSPSSAGYDNVAESVEEAGRRHAAESVSVDRAGRVRSHAVRDRQRVHDFPEPGDRCARSATSSGSTAAATDVDPEADEPAARRSRGPTRRFS